MSLQATSRNKLMMYVYITPFMRFFGWWKISQNKNIKNKLVKQSGCLNVFFFGLTHVF